MRRGVKIALVGALVVAILFLLPSLMAQLAFHGVQKELADMEGEKCLISVHSYTAGKWIHLEEPEDQAEFLALCRQLKCGGADLMLPDLIRTGSGEQAYYIDMSRQELGGENIFITLSNWKANNYTCRGYYSETSLNYAYGVHLDNTQPLYDYLEALFEAQ